MSSQLSEFSYFVYKRTYSRYDHDLSRSEEWEETIDRVIKACREQLKIEDVNFKRWKQLMLERKALPGGRFLWALGSRTVIDEGFLPLMNCSFVTIDCMVEPYRFACNMLMLGCGVGFSVERKYLKRACEHFTLLRAGPNIPTEKVHIVEDSRGGYVDFIKYCIVQGCKKETINYSIENLRPAGSHLRGFGGTSADPKILAETGEKIHKLLYERSELTPDDCDIFFDIMCLVAQMVVAGNVRRSALISIGDVDDKKYMNLKNWAIHGTIPPQRQFANMSVNTCFPSLELDDYYWQTFYGNSEAIGYVNTELSAEADRLRDLRRFPSMELTREPPVGFNPCAEQPLANKEVCCLSEIFLPNIEDERELQECAHMCYHICKAALNIGAPNEPETERVVTFNQRMGISLSGYATVSDRMRAKCVGLRDYLHILDAIHSEKMKWNPSIAITTIKPSGTISKLAGMSSAGIHYPTARFMIRRIRLHKDNPLVEYAKKSGIPVEPALMIDGKEDPSGTLVASFYLDNFRELAHSDGLTTRDIAESFPRLSQRFLKLIVQAQEEWSDNAVSVTFPYLIENAPDLKRLVLKVEDKLKVWSALPYFGHNFRQAPEEEITEEQYRKFMSERSPFESTIVQGETEEIDSSFDTESCGSGMCPSK